MTDRLAGFFSHYAFSARTFYTGTLCRSEGFGTDDGMGHLHLLRRGTLSVTSPSHPALHVEQPSLLFYPRPTSHRFQPTSPEGVDLVCASVDLGNASGNPLASALPDFMLMPFGEFPGLATTLELMFIEAFESHCGRQAAIDRLTEYLLIQILRHAMDSSQDRKGLLAGLADRRLAKVLSGIHGDPGRSWSLESLAQLAGMSRARFAVRFRDVVGMTPGDYLARWRIGLVQDQIRRGRPINLIADEVGYGSSSALTRAFRAHTGLTPREWGRKHRAGG